MPLVPGKLGKKPPAAHSINRIGSICLLQAIAAVSKCLLKSNVHPSQQDQAGHCSRYLLHKKDPTEMQRWRKGHSTLPNPKQTVPRVWRERFAKTDNATGTLPVPGDSRSCFQMVWSLVISGESQAFLGLLSLICYTGLWTRSLTLRTEEFTKKFQYQLSLRLKQ